MNQRRALAAAFGLLAVLGATGMVAGHVFHQPTLLKYAVTVGGPLLLSVLALRSHPVAIVAALLVIAAPFAGYVMTLKGTPIHLLVPIYLLAGYLLAAGATPHAQGSALRRGALIFAAAMIPSILVSSARMGELPALVALFLAAWIASRVSMDARGFEILLWGFVASAAFQALIGLWEAKTGHNLNLYGSAGQATYSNSYFFGFGADTRPPGAFYDPISLGNMLAIATPLALGLLIHNVRVREALKSAMAGLALAIIVAGLVATLDRMSWIAAIVAIVTVIWLLPRGQRRKALAAAAVVVALLLALGGVHSGSTVAQRAASIINPLNESGTGNGDILRVEIWKQAWSQFQGHPLLGIGIGQAGKTFASHLAAASPLGHAHSTYFQIGVEAGIIGLCGLIAVLLALRRDLRWARRDDRLWGSVLTAAALALLVCWLTDATIRYSSVATYMGILFGMVAGRSRIARLRAQLRERDLREITLR